jgi:23S rRNA pseudouridine2605 synthase
MKKKHELVKRTKPSTTRDERKPVRAPYSQKPKVNVLKKRDSLHPGDGSVRLNKYIANAGICSRRDADKLIETGAIKVNGKVVTTLGVKIKPGDVVQYDNQTLTGEALRYVLLNKPKGYISTLEDPQERKTVMELVKNACHERIYPVGRLDRNTTGLLLLTNDGDLAKKLTHPKHRVRKIYHVELSKALTKNDLLAIAAGVELEDGFIAPDAISYTGPGDDKKKIGIEIHSGKNRIVRRLFEKFEYEVVKLDRVVFANLTKKDLPRGKWRHLSLTEINILRRIQ